MLLLALLVAAATPVELPIEPLTRGFDPLAKGSAGVQLALYGNGTGSVGVTYFPADSLAARLDFGLDAVLASGNGTPAQFNIGLGLRFYAARRGPVGLFLSPSVSFGREQIAAGEYFFSDHLSAGGLLALALKVGNLAAAAGFSTRAELTTATSGVLVNIYF